MLLRRLQRIGSRVRSPMRPCILVLLGLGCGGRNASSAAADRPDASLDAAATLFGFVTSCAGQPCGTRCVIDPPNCTDPNSCNVGWCDPTLVPELDGARPRGCTAPPSLECTVPCTIDSECPPFVGQDHGPGCQDPSLPSWLQSKCLQH